MELRKISDMKKEERKIKIRNQLLINFKKFLLKFKFTRINFKSNKRRKT